MNVIPYIIGRELLAKRGVGLPSIGELRLRREPSAFADADKTMLRAPFDTIIIEGSAEDSSQHLMELVAMELGVDTDQAVEIYNDWYAENFDPTLSRLVVEGVGRINLCDVSMEEVEADFATLLCPLGSEPIFIGTPIAARTADEAEMAPIQNDEMPSQEIAIEEFINDNIELAQAIQNPAIPPPLPPRPAKQTSNTPNWAITLSLVVFMVAIIYLGYYFLIAKA